MNPECQYKGLFSGGKCPGYPSTGRGDRCFLNQLRAPSCFLLRDGAQAWLSICQPVGGGLQAVSSRPAQMDSYVLEFSKRPRWEGEQPKGPSWHNLPESHGTWGSPWRSCQLPICLATICSSSLLCSLWLLIPHLPSLLKPLSCYGNPKQPRK